MVDPRQTDAPHRYETDEERVQAALDEIEHFRWRADTPPDLSTLDGNLERAIEHLEYVVEDQPNTLDRVEAMRDEILDDLLVPGDRVGPYSERFYDTLDHAQATLTEALEIARDE